MGMQDEHGNRVITSADLYDMMTGLDHRIMDSLTTIRTEVVTLRGQAEQWSRDIAQLNARYGQHDSRIWALERFRAAIPAAIGVSMISLLAVVTDIVVRVLTHG